jgi:nucleoside-diphosphate-sugar epimerase
MLTRETGGGGVLMDIGTHLLDQLFHVLPGSPEVVHYAENARGGIETDCELRLSLATRWGPLPARVELSRTRELRGSLRVTCERGVVELKRGDFCQLHVETTPPDLADPVTGTTRRISTTVGWEGESELVGYKAFRAEFDDWLDAIAAGGVPRLSGESAESVVRVIETAYARSTPLAEDWVDESRAVSHAANSHKSTNRPLPRVLVTGAGGFLGTRTAELLHMSGAWVVRGMVRHPASAARLARWPLEITVADVTRPSEVAAALKGCDAVVHCAVGTSWPPKSAFSVTVEGTRTVAQLAADAGVRCFVHISSMAVHGNNVPARLDETAPLESGGGFDYGRAKYLAEQAVREAARTGMATVLLRPARIYGPFSRTFTIRPVAALRTGSLVLQGDASSPANMVYVDNVVEAISRALDAPQTAIGQAFLISEPDQLSWFEFYEYFARAFGGRVRVEAATTNSGAEAGPGLVRRWIHGGRDILTSPELRAMAKRVMNTEPFGVWPRQMWERSPTLQARVLDLLGVDQAVVYREPGPSEPESVTFSIVPTLVGIDRAVSALGYTAAVPRSRAMELTLAWCRHARLT